MKNPTIRPLAILALPLFTFGLAAQDAPPSQPETAITTLSVKANIVAITAIVHNKKGEHIRDLNKEDFKVKEDGKPIAIRYFDRDSDLPLQIGLMIDTSWSQKSFFDEQTKASSTFLDSMLTRPQDQAYVVRFDANVMLLQKMTPDLSKLKQSFTLLGTWYPLQKGADYKKNTRLYDALCTTTINVANRERGRRAVIVLTDGEDNGSTSDLEGTIRQVQRADTAVYTILYTKNVEHASRADETPMERLARTTGQTTKLTGRDAMERISLASGGRLFIVDKNMPVEKIYQQIEFDMRQQYRIGYTPKESPPGSYHTLEVKTADNKYIVQSRIGFYTPQ